MAENKVRIASASGDNSFAVSDWGGGEDVDTNALASKLQCKVVTSVSITSTQERAEARDINGQVVALAYYNKGAEITCEGIGKKDGDVLVPSDIVGLSEVGLDGLVDEDVTKAYVDEVSFNVTAGDWLKTSIKLSAFEHVTEEPSGD